MPHVLPAKARLADHLIPDGLEALIRTEREKGSSFESIAKSIYTVTDGQIEVSGVTAAAWAERLGFETSRLPKAEAS